MGAQFSDKFVHTNYLIGDRKLYCKYNNINNKNSPSVVFEAGLGDTSESWKYIQEKISKMISSLSYDRAGVGKSDSARIPRTCMDMVYDLSELLSKVPLKPPFIIVAHSFGGLVARLFASLYPWLVSGIILVDSAVEFKELFYEKVLFKSQIESNRDYFSNYRLNREKVDKQKSYNQITSNKGLQDIPLTIIIRGLPDDFDENLPNDKLLEIDKQLQYDLKKLSTKSKVVIAENSSHYIQQQQPELVIGEIKSLID